MVARQALIDIDSMLLIKKTTNPFNNQSTYIHYTLYRVISIKCNHNHIIDLVRKPRISFLFLFFYIRVEFLVKLHKINCHYLFVSNKQL